MNPVIGLDVPKGESHAQAFVDRGTPYGKKKKRGQYLMNLRYLTRQHESLTDMNVQAKLQFQAVLDQVFPEYCGVFGDLYSKASISGFASNS